MGMVVSSGEPAPVSVGTVFERFPASVRGAVVVRGEDPNPHQVRLEGAEVVEAHGSARQVCKISVDPVTVDLAPRAEVLVPFDLPLAGIPPGWYRVVAEVVVDGSQRVGGPELGKRFTVPWPKDEVRRGAIDASVRIDVPDSEGAVVESVKCLADRAEFRWRHAPGDDPEFGDLRVVAGGRRLPVIESTHEAATGRRTTVTYPVLQRHRQLTCQLERRFVLGRPVQRGTWSARLDLP